MTEPSATSFFRKTIENMSGYAPGEQPKRTGGWVKLNTNENPYPPSPTVSDALRGFDPADLRLYPDPECREIRGFLAELNGVGVDNIIAGNGSDDILTIALRSFVPEGGLTTCPEPTYSLYPVLAEIQGAFCVKIPLDANFTFPANFAERSESANLALIPNPNAPTGTTFDKKELRRFCREFHGVALIDEAYADFADDNCLEFTSEFDNVIVSRTLSKSYSLAGARFGYAVASKEIIAGMMKVRDSYNVNALTQRIALAALRDRGYFEKTVEKIRTTRRRLTNSLRDLGFDVPESSANFVFAEPPYKDGERVYNALKERGILVRWFSGETVVSRIRITVGTDNETDKLLAAVEKIV